MISNKAKSHFQTKSNFQNQTIESKTIQYLSLNSKRTKKHKIRENWAPLRGNERTRNSDLHNQLLPENSPFIPAGENLNFVNRMKFETTYPNLQPDFGWKQPVGSSCELIRAALSTRICIHERRGGKTRGKFSRDAAPFPSFPRFPSAQESSRLRGFIWLGVVRETPKERDEFISSPLLAPCTCLRRLVVKWIHRILH